MNNNFDVIIIGAGPGGLNCAKTLEKSDLKVLLIEKNKVIGPKICAGGVTTKDLAYLKIPDNIIDYSYKKIIFEAPSIKTHLAYPKTFICTIDRPKFGQWQVKQLQKTKIITGKRVVKISKNSLVLENGDEYFFKSLVGADGSNSIVRRHLNLKNDNVEIGIQYLVPKEDCNMTELLLRLSSREFHYCYGWIFPHKDFVSIGTGGIAKKTDILKLKLNLENWISKMGISLENAKFESHPLNVDYSGYHFDNIYLVGDSAGLVSPLTGEGIYSALVSGEEIAKKIIDTSYEPARLEKIVKMLDYHRKVLKIIERAGIFRQILFNKVIKKCEQPEFVQLAVEKFL